MKPGTPAQALHEVRRHVLQDLVNVSHHARIRMRARGVAPLGLRQILITATVATLQEQGTWLLSGGVDEDGDGARVVVTIEDETFVITLFE